MYFEKNLDLFIPIFDNPIFKPIYTHFWDNPFGPSIFILNFYHSFKKQNPKTLSSSPFSPFLFLFFFFFFSSISYFLSFPLSLAISTPILTNNHLTSKSNSRVTADRQPTVVPFRHLTISLSWKKKNQKHVVNHSIQSIHRSKLWFQWLKGVDQIKKVIDQRSNQPIWYGF